MVAGRLPESKDVANDEASEQQGGDDVAEEEDCSEDIDIIWCCWYIFAGGWGCGCHRVDCMMRSGGLTSVEACLTIGSIRSDTYVVNRTELVHGQSQMACTKS